MKFIKEKSTKISQCKWCNGYFTKTHNRQTYCPTHLKDCSKYARQEYKAQHEFQRRREPIFESKKYLQLGSKDSLSANRNPDFEAEARTVHKALMKIKRGNKTRMTSFEYQYELEKIESTI